MKRTFSTMFGKKLTDFIDSSRFKRCKTNMARQPVATTDISSSEAQLEQTPPPSTEHNIKKTTTSPALSELSDTSLTSTLDEDFTNNVHESSVSLVPACCIGHGRWKGKEKRSEPRSCELKAIKCGTTVACKKAVVTPFTARQQVIRLATHDAQHDLRRWLTTPNSRICAVEDERSIDFLRQERFALHDLRDAMFFAINHIRYEHSHIDSLVEYATRKPYGVNIKTPVASKADMNYFVMEAAHFDGVPREGLEEDVFKAAQELDYLRDIAERIGARILDAKAKAAKWGDRWEIAELLRLEVVSEEWVQDKCLIF